MDLLNKVKEVVGAERIGVRKTTTGDFLLSTKKSENKIDLITKAVLRKFKSKDIIIRRSMQMNTVGVRKIHRLTTKEKVVRDVKNKLGDQGDKVAEAVRMSKAYGKTPMTTIKP